tara:strand:- start:959 stop:1312 length:354 start_codon:yes stop_codon:yes gene_type:complete
MNNRRVNISYSIRLSNLEDETQRLLFGCFEKLKKLEHNIDDKDFKSVLIPSTLDKISQIREVLSEADYMLDDVSKIIIGYENFKNNTTEEAEEEAIAEIDALKQKIDEFKETLSSEE